MIESKLEEKANDKRFAYYPDSFKANDLKDLYNIVKQDDDDFFKKLWNYEEFNKLTNSIMVKKNKQLLI